jgi:hypothetical protein
MLNAFAAGMAPKTGLRVICFMYSFIDLRLSKVAHGRGMAASIPVRGLPYCTSLVIPTFPRIVLLVD